MISMTEKKGHFVQGRWVEDSPAPARSAGSSDIETRLSQTTKSVIASIDDVMSVTRDLVTTEEGRKYIEKTVRDTEKQVQRSFDEILMTVKSELEKKTKK